MTARCCGRWPGDRTVRRSVAVGPDEYRLRHPRPANRRAWRRGRHSRQGALESALARPPNLEAYGDPDIADLAAAYVYGLARSHAFTDGNKRTAWVTGRLILADNGARLEFDPYDAIRLMESVAADSVSEAELAVWLRSRLASP